MTSARGLPRKGSIDLTLYVEGGQRARCAITGRFGLFADCVCAVTVDVKNTAHISTLVIQQLWATRPQLSESQREISQRLISTLLNTLIKRRDGDALVRTITDNVLVILDSQSRRAADDWREYAKRFAAQHFLRHSILGDSAKK